MQSRKWKTVIENIVDASYKNIVGNYIQYYTYQACSYNLYTIYYGYYF